MPDAEPVSLTYAPPAPRPRIVRFAVVSLSEGIILLIATLVLRRWIGEILTQLASARHTSEGAIKYKFGIAAIVVWQLAMVVGLILGAISSTIVIIRHSRYRKLGTVLLILCTLAAVGPFIA